MGQKRAAPISQYKKVQYGPPVVHFIPVRGYVGRGKVQGTTPPLLEADPEYICMHFCATVQIYVCAQMGGKWSGLRTPPPSAGIY